MTPLEAFKVLHLPTPPFTSSKPCPSKEQIKKAHRKLTLQTHPDKNVGKPEATAQNQECNNARDAAYKYIKNAHSSDDNGDEDNDPTNPTEDNGDEEADPFDFDEPEEEDNEDDINESEDLYPEDKCNFRNVCAELENPNRKDYGPNIKLVREKITDPIVSWYYYIFPNTIIHQPNC